MRYFIFAASMFLPSVIAHPSVAWTTLQGPTEVVVQHETPDYIIELKCSAARGNSIIFSIGITRGRTFGDVRSVMLWIEYTDGRLGRRPITVTNHGHVVSGDWIVSEEVLMEFQQGVSMEVALNGRNTILKTHMNGTGAARLAFKERCGI